MIVVDLSLYYINHKTFSFEELTAILKSLFVTGLIIIPICLFAKKRLVEGKVLTIFDLVANEKIILMKKFFAILVLVLCVSSILAQTNFNKKKNFYFNPYDNINTGELSKKPWQIDYIISNNKMTVGIIWDKALESQINLGDEILSVNGFDYQQMDTCELLNLDNTFSNETISVELRDIKTGEIKKVDIKRM